MALSLDLRINGPQPTPVLEHRDTLGKTAPAEPALAPVPVSFVPGTQLPTMTSGGAGGQKHQLALMGRVQSGDRAQAALEKLLRTKRVRIPTEGALKARLYALIPDAYAREKVANPLLRDLSKLAGKSCTVGGLLEACAQSKTLGSAGLGGLVASMMSASIGSNVRLVAGLLDDPAPMIELARLAGLARNPVAPSITLEEARQRLAEEGSGALPQIIAHAPHHPELAVDLVRGLASHRLNHLDAEEALQAFGVAAIGPLVRELQSGELSTAPYIASQLEGLGPLAQVAVKPLIDALLRLERAPSPGPEAGGPAPGWAKERMLAAIAAIGGRPFMERPEAQGIISAELRSGDPERVNTAIGLLSKGGASSLPYLPLLQAISNSHHDLATVIGGIGPEAWSSLPALLRRADGFNLWWAVRDAVGAPPEDAARALFEQLKQRGTHRYLLEPLQLASSEIKKEVAWHLIHKFQGGAGVSDRPSAINFLSSAVGKLPSDSGLKGAVVKLLQGQLKAPDADSSRNAYLGLTRLLAPAEAESLTKRVFEDPNLHAWAVLEILHSKDPLPQRLAAFSEQLRRVANDPAEDLDLRDRAREVLGEAPTMRAQRIIDDLRTTERPSYSALVKLESLVEPQRWPETLLHLAEEGTPGTRWAVAHPLLESLKSVDAGDEHRPLLLGRLFAAIERHPDLKARIGDDVARLQRRARPTAS